MDAFAAAQQHHQAGRLSEAEALYRQVLAAQPAHADALHYMGVLAHQVGRCDLAADWVGRAIAARPGYAEAHYTSAVVLTDLGRPDDAIAAYRRAVALRPTFAEAWFNLGNALAGRGQFDQAVPAYRQALAARPGQADVHHNLAHALRAAGQLAEAVAACRAALSLQPNFPEALNTLGHALMDQGLADDAAVAYGRAVALSPDHAPSHNHLGNALRARGQIEAATAAYRRAIALGSVDAHGNLAVALRDAGRFDEAIAACTAAITADPAAATPHYNLGLFLAEQGRSDEAIAVLRRAVALRPAFAEAHNNLGNALKDQGRIEPAIAAYRAAVAAAPGDAAIHSNLIFALHYHPADDRRAIADEARRWNHAHGSPSLRPARPHANDRQPDRRLRVGYVSADLRDHPCAHYIQPLLRGHDSAQVEVFCYANVPRPDAVTARLRAAAHHWRDVAGITDDAVVERVRADGIDVLVDLQQHTAGNRLPVFARRPAPVQATWLGYPSTTGLTALDYRLSDPHLDPVGMDESVYAERTIRLPDTFWCYDPFADDPPPPVGPVPALLAGHVTFGCLNNFAKVNDTFLDLAAAVLTRVPRSRLLLLAKPGRHREATWASFAARGVDAGRVEFAAPCPRPAYLALYHRVDVGLDCGPFNGHTTSLDSAWMGVPVVTLPGRTAVSRGGACLAANLGLPELIAHSAEQYVDIAAGLVDDLSGLGWLRSTLRAQLEGSPLMDGPRFARHVEAAYRQMWHRWCAVGPDR